MKTPSKSWVSVGMRGVRGPVSEVLSPTFHDASVTLQEPRLERAFRTYAQSAQVGESRHLAGVAATGLPQEVAQAFDGCLPRLVPGGRTS